MSLKKTPRAWAFESQTKPKAAKARPKAATPLPARLPPPPKAVRPPETPPHEEVQRLMDMLTFKRPHGTEGVDAFVETYLMPLFHAHEDSWSDAAGNLYFCNDTQSTTLFTCHVDTVHRTIGKQKVYHHDGLLSTDGECLGADDGAGVWLLLEMLKAGVSGTFAFFQGEERGGIGSRFCVDTHPQFLAQFERAIAFDRRGTTDIITHQSSMRCCSDDFARALAAGLNETLPEDYAFFAPSDGGSFTDTAQMTGAIGECTNVSVGYRSEHGSSETLDTRYLRALRDACCKLQWDHLPSVRQPGEVERKSYGGYYTGNNWDWDDYRTFQLSGWMGAVKDPKHVTLFDLYEFTDKELVEFINDEPRQAAALMRLLMR